MVKKGVYRHYKGHEYRVHSIARHSETLEDYVVYEPMYKSVSKLWIRPLSMFIETVDIDGKRVPRFEFIRKE